MVTVFLLLKITQNTKISIEDTSFFKSSCNINVHMFVCDTHKIFLVYFFTTEIASIIFENCSPNIFSVFSQICNERFCLLIGTFCNSYSTYQRPYLSFKNLQN